MKALALLSIFLLTASLSFGKATKIIASETSKVSELNNDQVPMLKYNKAEEDTIARDTTYIRIWKQNIEIIKIGNKSEVTITNNKNYKREKKEKNDWNKRGFNGHWSGFELGVNGFANKDYGIYSNGEEDFMDLNGPKSIEVNINFWEYDIALSENRLGIVTGMGWTMNNYRFDNDITIKKVGDKITPIDLTLADIDKSKLTASFLTVPLIMEYQIPVNNSSNYVFISGGLVGALNLGSHTKYKSDDAKSKDRGSFAINPLRYSLIAKIGLKDLSFYATYSLVPFFKDGKGPELYPFTVGLTLLNF